MNKKVTIGTRGSRLAMIQTNTVAEAIRRAFPETEVIIETISTRGDKDQITPLETVAGLGIFVKELEEAILDGRIDLAVHSLKDMPTELPEGLQLSAITKREYPGDVLITRGEKLAELKSGARIGTGSLRRASQLKALRSDLCPCSIRGNVDTRVNKAISGEVDGVILAAAAMKRMGWEERITEYLPVDRFLPAIGQGAVAIETRSDDPETIEIVSQLDHSPSRYAVTAERAFLRTLGGGCRAPIAALSKVEGNTLTLDGLTIDPVNGQTLRGLETGTVDRPEEPGIRLGNRLLAQGADKFLTEQD